MSSRRPPRNATGGRDAGSCTRAVVVTPKSSRNEVTVQADGTITVRVTGPPADGAANKAVLAALSDALSLPRSRIEIVRGPSFRQKLVRFEMSEDELERRLKLVGGAEDQVTG